MFTILNKEKTNAGESKKKPERGKQLVQFRNSRTKLLKSVKNINNYIYLVGLSEKLEANF